MKELTLRPTRQPYDWDELNIGASKKFIKFNVGVDGVGQTFNISKAKMLKLIKGGKSK